MAAPPVSVPVAGVDWTALHNFAALRGQLRVSFTPRCNIACWFCHNEGDVPPPLTRQDRSHQPRLRQLDADAYLVVIGSLMNAGLKRVYFTGGEPLTSPIARPVLEGLDEPRRWPTPCTQPSRVGSCSPQARWPSSWQTGPRATEQAHKRVKG